MMCDRLSRFLLIGLLLLVGVCQAQESTSVTANFTWTTTFPAEPLAVVADGPRGAYVLTKGNTLTQIDGKGRERWKQTFANWPTIQKLAVGPNGRLVVAGEFTKQFTTGDSTYRLDDATPVSTFVAELDSTHTPRWVTYVITAKGQMSQPASLATDPTGAVFVFGRQAGTGIPFLCNFDADGRFVTASLYGAPTVPTPQPVTVVTDTEGTVRLGITEHSRSTAYGLLMAMADDSVRWRTYVDEAMGADAFRRFDTSPLDMGIDAANQLVVLSNYTLTDRSIGVRIETGQVLLHYDASGRSQWIKTGVTRADSAVAKGVLVDKAGAFVAYGGYDGPYNQETNQYGTADYISLAGYAPTGARRWSARLNAPTGMDRLIGAALADNGSVLLLGKTGGTLTVGQQMLTGTSAAPVYYLTQLQPFVLQPSVASVTLCAGNSVPLSGTYTGYFEQGLTLQLTNDKGNFANPQLVGTVPIGVAGNLFDVKSYTTTVVLASSLVAGERYQLRAISVLPRYVGDPVSVTVGTAPAIPAVSQQGEELVASTSLTTGVTYQWYTNSRQPVAGATSARFRPMQAGAYYAVAISGGCPSLASEALAYLITATEPTGTPLTVYPNPAIDRLRVRWPTGGAPGQVTLTDLAGRQVQQRAKTGDETELDISALNSGLYLLIVQVTDQPVQVRKVQVK